MAKMTGKPNRREFLTSAVVGTTAGVVALSLEEKALLAAKEDQTPTPPKGKTAGKMPMGKIGKLDISRMICGGNLTSGFAHSRDLVYVSSLLKHYFTDEKIFETWKKCEECGVNTAILRLDNHVLRLTKEYWNKKAGKLQWIAQIKASQKNLTADAKKAIDNGAVGVYVQGGVGDSLVKSGKVDVLGKFVESARKAGVIAGIGGHLHEVPVACEKAGIKPDFYMKTLHSKKYWSAGHPKEHDNIWCKKADETIEFMKKVEAPWIAFKVLAAGAISPTSGFKYALTNGADFMCVGMFDFQVAEDVKILKGQFARGIKRQRPWRG